MLSLTGSSRLARRLPWLLAWLLAGLLIALAAGWLLWPRSPDVQTLSIQAGEASRVLAVNGRIRPRLSVDVKATNGSLLVYVTANPELAVTANW